MNQNKQKKEQKKKRKKNMIIINYFTLKKNKNIHLYKQPLFIYLY